MYNLKHSELEDALRWPKPVHRLDTQTSGLLLIAKTAQAQVNLGRQFQNREIFKRYRAVLIGKLQNSGVIDNPMDDRVAKTEFAPVRHVRSLKNGWLTLVDLYPLTGRTHQLRIHMADHGYPILGDKLYGPEGQILKGQGMFLCAVELSFVHPVQDTQVSSKIEEPPKFKTFLDREQRRWNKYHP
jgi:23S rRNA-/tRNA-specific pseudouridylate synthase